MGSNTHFTVPTTNYWQEILDSTKEINAIAETQPWRYGYPARLPDSRILMLPIRPFNPTNPNEKVPTEAVASLLVNQASIDVVQQLGEFLANVVKRYNPDVIVGLPTLGLTLAPIVAQRLGHKRYVPLGYSRKFWYDEELSAVVSSITSPSVLAQRQDKKVYLDPNQLPLVLGKRVVVIDDAVSSGSTLNANWDLLERLGVNVVGCGVVMKQGGRWEAVLGKERTEKVVWVFESPLLKAVEGGWDIRI